MRHQNKENNNKTRKSGRVILSIVRTTKVTESKTTHHKQSLEHRTC